MRKRSNKGNLLLVVAVLLLLIVIAFALLATQQEAAQPSPVVEEASWRVNGEKVTYVTVGSNVEVRVVVKATGEYNGSIVVKVRKDIALWFDRDYAISTTPANLTEGQKLEIKMNFIPDEASGTSMRGYFVEVGFSAAGTTWTMDDDYPPRLQVVPSD